jgi:uncharacterized repeat protein (TIGR03803 family)
MKRTAQTLLPILMTAALLVLAAAKVGAQVKPDPASYKQKVLFNFAAAPNGLGPRGGVIMDASGNLYGTTFTGGIVSQQCIITNEMCGVVYKIDKNGNETILHDFTGGADGGGPLGNLVFDSSGNLYGTTSTGGNSTCQCGVVYKIDTTGNQTVLYTFTDAENGFGPWAGLAIDASGNLYGTNATGGSYGLGSIFKIDASGNYSVLHNFEAWDGQLLFLAPLTLDPAGNLYGVTAYGGATTTGTVFKLATSGKLTVLYNFTNGVDGGFPTGPVALDSAGNLYGATYEGGAPNGLSGAGVVFKVAPSGKYSVLYSFPSTGYDGSYGGGVIIDSTGNMYGTTSWDGKYQSGSVFMVSPTGHVTTLYDFKGGTDGRGVWASLMEDAAGNLYGTAESGGATGGGVVFELSPQ